MFIFTKRFPVARTSNHDHHQLGFITTPTDDREHGGVAEGSQAAGTGAEAGGGGGGTGGEDGRTAGDSGTPGAHDSVISRRRRARSAESNAARLSRKHDRRADPQRAAAEGGAEEGMGQ